MNLMKNTLEEKQKTIYDALVTENRALKREVINLTMERDEAKCEGNKRMLNARIRVKRNFINLPFYPCI